MLVLLLSPEERAARHARVRQHLDKVYKYKKAREGKALKGEIRYKVYVEKYHLMPECGVIYTWYKYTDRKRPNIGVHYILPDGRSGDIDCTHTSRKKKIYEVLNNYC